MKLLLRIFAALFLVAMQGKAIDFPATPDQVLLSNGFRSVTRIDSFVLATTHDALCVMSFDSTAASWRIVNSLILPDRPDRAKQSNGRTFWIATTASTLLGVATNQLPDLTLLHRFDFDQPFHDFAANDSVVYIARGFAGVWRYRIDDFDDAAFLDSSMLGIHAIQTELDGSSLFVLDDYNGVIRFDRSGGGFGTFDSLWYIPLQATSFAVRDSIIAVAATPGTLFVGTFTQEGARMRSSSVIGTPEARVGLFGPFAYSLGQLGVQMMSMVDTRTGESWFSVLTTPPEASFQATLVPAASNMEVLCADALGGLSAYQLQPSYFAQGARAVYDRPGAITSLSFIDTLLYTGGIGNPVDRFVVNESRRLSSAGSIFDGVAPVQDIASAHDTTFIAYPSLQATFALTPDDSGGWSLASVIPSPADLRSIELINWPTDTMRVIALVAPTSIQLWRLQDTLVPQRRSDIKTIGTIEAVAVVDSLLVFSTNKRECWVYRIYNDLSLEFRAQIGTGQPIKQFVQLGPDNGAWEQSTLIAFEGNRAERLSLANPQLPQLSQLAMLAVSVEAATLDDSLLYVADDYSIAAYNIANGSFDFLASGGRGGSMLTARNGLVAASDGTSILLYDLGPTDQIPTDVEEDPDRLPSGFVLEQNYPNPFNPTTTIAFTLPRLSSVSLEILNLLGQRVSTLHTGLLPGGEHQIVWNGTTDNGTQAASGLYFYRLQAGEFRTTRKMLLVR